MDSPDMPAPGYLLWRPRKLKSRHTIESRKEYPNKLSNFNFFSITLQSFLDFRKVSRMVVVVVVVAVGL